MKNHKKLKSKTDSGKAKKEAYQSSEVWCARIFNLFAEHLHPEIKDEQVIRIQQKLAAYISEIRDQ